MCHQPVTFLVPHKKPHGVRGLGKNDHMNFDPKLGHGIYDICCTPCAYSFCTSIIEQPWITGFTAQKQPHYQPVKY